MTKSKIMALIGTAFLVTFFYFFTRIQHLTSIPVFGDEAIYIRWSQIIKSVETLRFIPLTDGKQPLFMWFLAAFFSLFSKDPLIAGRLISIFAGYGILIGIFLTTVIAANFKQKTNDIFLFLRSSIFKYYFLGFLAGFLYLATPFAFFF